MSLTGDDNALYVVARQVLLDGLAALGSHQDSVILIGAQAIYLHVGEADLAVAAFTSDADFVIDPGTLAVFPLLERAMTEAGFREGAQPGIWVTTREVNSVATDIGFDLLVPDSLGGGGSRAARLPPHGGYVARKVKGLEAALVDHGPMQVASLPPDPPRSMRIRVAGPSALLVAKLHKLGERAQSAPQRLKPKDALDVLRLLRGVETETLARGLVTLRENPVSGEATLEALGYLRSLFGQTMRLAARSPPPLWPDSSRRKRLPPRRRPSHWICWTQWRPNRDASPGLGPPGDHGRSLECSGIWYPTGTP